MDNPRTLWTVYSSIGIPIESARAVDLNSLPRFIVTRDEQTIGAIQSVRLDAILHPSKSNVRIWVASEHTNLAIFGSALRIEDRGRPVPRHTRFRPSRYTRSTQLSSVNQLTRPGFRGKSSRGSLRQGDETFIDRKHSLSVTKPPTLTKTLSAFFNSFATMRHAQNRPCGEHRS